MNGRQEPVKKLSNATFNIYRSLFSMIFRQAMKNKKVKHNPARGVEQTAVTNTREKQLSSDEF